jgi:hypothetical protein
LFIVMTPMKRRSISTRRDSATSQKTPIFVFVAVRTCNLTYFVIDNTVRLVTTVSVTSLFNVCTVLDCSQNWDHGLELHLRYECLPRRVRKKSCKNAHTSFAMSICLSAFENLKTVRILSDFRVTNFIKIRQQNFTFG